MGAAPRDARVAVIRNERSAGLGNFEPVLRSRGYDIQVIDASDDNPALGTELGAVADAELLIVLGSSHGVYETERHPFISDEIAFVRRRLDARLPTLGVCFGAQLIAAALGEQVRPGPTIEVGYRTVTPTAAGLASPVRHIAGMPVAEWHGDTFALPADVTLLASSEAYENEAFGIGDWLLAVQFHPELTDEMHEDWLVSDLDYARSAGEEPDELRADRARFGAGMQLASARMLADYLDRLKLGAHPAE